MSPTGAAGGDTISVIAAGMTCPISASATIPTAAAATITAPHFRRPIPPGRAAGGRKWTARIAAGAVVGVAKACVQVATDGKLYPEIEAFAARVPRLGIPSRTVAPNGGL